MSATVPGRVGKCLAGDPHQGFFTGRGQPDVVGEVVFHLEMEPVRQLARCFRQGHIEGLPGRRGQGADCPPGLQLRSFNSVTQPAQYLLISASANRIQVPGQVGQFLGQPVVQVPGDPAAFLGDRRVGQGAPVGENLPQGAH